MSLWAIQSLASVSRGLERFADGRKPSYETIESLLLQLELVYREFLVKHALLSLDANEEEAISHIGLDMLLELEENWRSIALCTEPVADDVPATPGSFNRLYAFFRTSVHSSTFSRRRSLLEAILHCTSLL